MAIANAEKDSQELNVVDILENEKALLHLEHLMGNVETLELQEYPSFDKDNMLVGMDNLVADVAVLMKIRSRSQVVVDDDDVVAAANAVQYHVRDNDAVEHYLLLLVHRSPFLTENQMHPDDVRDVGLRGCSGNDLDCPRRIIVTRHEHPRWNRKQCLVW